MHWGSLLALSPLQIALAILWPKDGHVHLLRMHCQVELRGPPFAETSFVLNFGERNVPS